MHSFHRITPLFPLCLAHSRTRKSEASLRSLRFIPHSKLFPQVNLIRRQTSNAKHFERTNSNHIQSGCVGTLARRHFDILGLKSFSFLGSRTSALSVGTDLMNIVNAIGGDNKSATSGAVTQSLRRRRQAKRIRCSSSAVGGSA